MWDISCVYYICKPHSKDQIIFSSFYFHYIFLMVLQEYDFL